MSNRSSGPKWAMRALCAAAAATIMGLFGAASAQDDELTIAQSFEQRTLDPAGAGWRLRQAGVTESIVIATREGEIAPGLAENWEVSEDGLTWTFMLRDGAVFHDGSPVTGAAVEQSFEQLGPDASIYSRIPVADITSQEQTVTFELEEPFGAFLAYVMDPAAAVLAPTAFADDGSVQEVIGTGPYMIGEVDLPRSWTLLRNDEYWGEVGLFATVRIEAAPSPDTRVNIALAGDADIVQELPEASVERIDGSGVTHIQQVVLPRHIMMLVNADRPQFETAELRRAFSLAIDRESIAAAVLGDADLAATQYVPDYLSSWYLDDAEPFAYDLGEANRILDEAGWVRGDDGIRQKDGVRFAGTVRTFPQRAYLPVIAEILQQQFAEIGFELTVDVGDWSRIHEGREDGTLDLGLGIRTLMYQVPDPIANIDLDFARDQAPADAVGATNWHSQELTDAVANYLTIADEAERAPYREAIARILNEELPVIPIAFTAENVGVSNRLVSFPIDSVLQEWRLNEIELVE